MWSGRAEEGGNCWGEDLRVLEERGAKGEREVGRRRVESRRAV